MMAIVMRLALLGLLLALAGVAAAKGIFQAQGHVSDVRRDGDTITFRFKGQISAGYASAPDNDPRRRWHDIGWSSVDVPVTLRDWTRRGDPGARDEAPALDAVQEDLARAARTQHRIGFSLDNPAFSLTNRGQLAGVAGTFIYQHDEEPRR
jgi:hypothetical protein